VAQKAKLRLIITSMNKGNNHTFCLPMVAGTHFDNELQTMIILM